MSNPNDSFRAKVSQIFQELAGERSARLDPGKFNQPVQSVIREAFTDDLGAERADLLGFHMADWNEGAAFMVALHLYPERFTKEEIEAGIISVLLETTDHITAASTLNNMPIEDTFELGIFDHINKKKKKSI